MHFIWKISLLLVVVVMLAACGDVAGDPSDTVEQYLEAKVAADVETVTRLLCSSMESSLTLESGSFATVDARIENMACSRIGESDTVSCTGEIVATYGTEDTSFPLKTYNVVQEDGEWRWCGEAQ